MSHSAAQMLVPTWRRLGSLLFVVVCIVAIEYWFGWQSLLAPWAALDPLALLGGTLLMVMTYVTRAMRLYRYFDSSIDFGQCVRLLLQHNFVNNLLPMRTGEAAFPVLMQRYFRIPMRDSVTALLWFRGLDLHALVLLLGVALTWRYEPVTAIVFAVAWIGLLVTIFNSAQGLARRLGSRSDRLSQRLRVALLALPGSVNAFAESWFWTILNWGMKLLVFAWILSLFGSLSFFYSLLGAIGGELSSVLPIHGPAGIGTYQAGVAAAIVPLGASLQQAIQGGVNLHLFVLGVSILGGLVALIPLHGERLRSAD